MQRGKEVDIPVEVMGLVIGKGHSNLNRIGKETGTKIEVKNNKIYVSGGPQETKNAIKQLKTAAISSMQRGKEVDIPMEVMGLVIGKGRSNLNRIEKETKTKIEVKNDKIYVSGGPQKTKDAIKQLKTAAFEGIYYNRIKKQFTCDTYDFVDGSGRKCEFRLVPVECPRQDWHQNKEYFKIERDDEEDQMVSDGEIGDLSNIITKVLQKIQAIDGRYLTNMPKADFWCHFGHLYITGNVDEDDQGEVYALEDFQSQFNIENGWKMMFDTAIKDMKIQELETALADSKYEKIPPHVRYDLSFILTPSYTRIRAKFFLDLDGKPNLNFMDQFLDVKGDALSSTSRYVFCHHFVTRAKVSIAIPAYDMDVRITIRTVSSTPDMEETEHEETLKKYLDRVTFSAEGEILLPDEKLMPDGCFLHYIRKCNRRSYSYTGREEDSFTIVVSEEEEIDMDAGPQAREKKVSEEEDIVDAGPKAREKRTDIHLYSDKCNQLLRSGDWEPEQITRKLPIFLLALRDVQDNVRN